MVLTRKPACVSMWTKYNNFISLKLRIKRVTIPILIPILVVEEIAELLKVIKLFVWSSKAKIKLSSVLDTIQFFINEIRYIGNLDIVDIDVEDDDKKVKIKISMW